MKKVMLMLLVLALLLVGAAPSVAGPTGFKLTGADAAYADFDDGTCTLFVGYVWARKVKYFATGEVVRPHSDLEVKLYCDSVGYEGLVSTVGDDRAEIVTLTWADVDEIPVPLSETITATVDLNWTAAGDVFKEKIRDECSFANHRTRWADVVGTVTVTGLDTTELVFDGSDLIDGARITHYNERGWC